ncbi:MAG: CoA transferase [Clostridiales bacterium]|nr:CoA transferase [Clostridiales bacterium]
MLKFLEGVKVVELGSHIAVPKAGRLLAEWGASVVKVEPPQGEAWRVIGNSYGTPYTDDCNPIFQAPNSHKKDIAINLKNEQGREVLMKLLADADVFITNTRLKGLQKLGLAYEDLKDRFPRLIYAHFSGYGAVGPEKDRPGFDIAAYWAKAGMPLEWCTAETGPSRPLPGFGDSTVATVLLSGVLAALYGREKTGKGEYLQASLYGCALWFNSSGIVQAQYQPENAYPKSRYDQPTPYHAIYQTKDGDYFFFSIPTWDNAYDKLLTMMGLAQYIGDPRFATLAACRENLRFIIPEFDKAFHSMTTEEVRAGFDSMDCVFEVVADAQSIVHDKQAWENGYLQKITMENGTEVVIPTTPVQFASAELPEFELAPQIGGDSKEILAGLGYDQNSIDELFGNRAIL